MKTKNIISFLTFLLVLGISAIAFAQPEGAVDATAIKTQGLANNFGLIALAAGLGIGVAALGGGIGQGRAAATP